MKKFLLFISLLTVLGGLVFILNKNIGSKSSEDSVELNDQLADEKRIDHKDPVKNLLDPNAKNRISSDMKAKMPKVDEGMMMKMHERMVDVDEDPYVVNEMFDMSRRGRDPHLEDKLIQIANNPNEKDKLKKVFAIQHLVISAKEADPHSRKKYEEEILKHLEDSNLDVSREAFWGLARLKHEKAKEIILDNYNNAKDHRIDLIIRGAEMFNINEAIPDIRKYLNDKNVVVCVAAMSALSNWKDEISREKITELMLDPNSNKRVKHVAKMSLKKYKS